MAHYVLLHGALGAAADLSALANALMNKGHTAEALQLDPNGLEAVPAMAEKLAHHLESQPSPAHVFGYSMGGYVALYLAAYRPELFVHLTTLAVKLNWQQESANVAAYRETLAWMSPSVLSEKFPNLQQELERTHGEEWANVSEQTAAMLVEIATHNYLSKELAVKITTPVTLLIGQNDKMVTLTETQHVAAWLPYARCEVLPGVKHPLPSCSVETLLAHLLPSISSPF